MTKLNESGLKNMLLALSDVEKAANNAVSRAERRMAEAEAELMATRQIHGFIQVHREWLLERIAEIEEAKAGEA